MGPQSTVSHANTAKSRALDGREIGPAQPGPITQRVRAAFRQRVTREGVKL